VGSARIDYTLGVPGGVIFQTFRASVTVSAIEPATRMATLQLPDGKKFTVRVSPDVTTFDQIRVGDRVTATVLQKIEASLTKQDGDGTTAAGDHAPNGNQTGDAAGKTMQMPGSSPLIRRITPPRCGLRTGPPRPSRFATMWT
jgi:hypothetical protein